MSNAFKWDAKTHSLTLAKTKQPLKIKWSRSFVGVPSSCYVSKTKTGKYYISIFVEEEIGQLPESSKTIGVDLGIKNVAICSDSITFSNIRTTKKYERKLAKAQRKLAKKVKGSNNFNKSNLGKIVRQLEYKATWYGRTISKIDHWFLSSKKCSCCGVIYPGKWTLAIREWTCPSCSNVNDRDLNASRNIHIEGLRLLAT